MGVLRAVTCHKKGACAREGGREGGIRVRATLTQTLIRALVDRFDPLEKNEFAILFQTKPPILFVSDPHYPNEFVFKIVRG